MQVLERRREALEAALLEKGAQAQFEPRAIKQRFVPGAGLAQFRSDGIELLVFAGQGLGLGVGDGVHLGREVADAVAVGREAEFHLGRNLVALGDRHLTHVVAEAAEFRPLPIVPGARRAHPGADAVLHLRIGPMADDDFARQTHAGVDEARLPVAVGRLVQVHEVHVDRVPRQVAIELGVEMDERLLERVQPAHPHFRRRERVHPKDQAGAVRIGIRVEAKLRDFVRRRQQGLEFGLEREFGRARERARDLSPMGRDLLERTRTVEMLRAANEPDFGGGEIDHGHFRFLTFRRTEGHARCAYLISSRLFITCDRSADLVSPPKLSCSSR